MDLITETAALAEFTEKLATEPFVTVDTEFVRERTYWPRLCLLQLGGADRAVAVDALAPGIDLSPVAALFSNSGPVKVFHSARQDIEIFVNLWGEVPTPLFDTQVAAMVCGFGDSVGYEKLVNKIARAKLDKASRFTDWAHRPLTERQLKYVLGDVTYLREIYCWLEKELARTGRAAWVSEEMEILKRPETYLVHPEDAWRRLKTRSTDPRFLAIVRELAAWREEAARTRNIPRNWIIKDDVLLDIAARGPQSPNELRQSRRVPKDFSESKLAPAILEAVARGRALPAEECPMVDGRPDLPANKRPLVELMKVLLKLKCDEHDVAQKLVASSEDLERIALDDSAAVPALQGWRRHVFGDDALALKQGRIALTVDSRGLRQIPI